jgi:hypothetical protein
MEKKKTLSQKVNFKLDRTIQSLLTIISPVLSTRYTFRRKLKKPLNLKTPVTFSEKINWLKLFAYSKDPLVIQCSDKYAVREYIESVGCPEILNEHYGVYENANEINWDILPQKFVVKWNFGSGYNLFCSDKNSFDIKAAIKILNKWGKRKPHLYFSVMHYKYIKRKIIVEKFIEGKHSELPEDYKIYCFNGEPLYVMICEEREKGKPRFYFFNTKWELARINKSSINIPDNFVLKKPFGMEDAFKYAELLSKPFPFVRVDFYLSDGNPILGELTFVPAGGFDSNYFPETELLFGNMLDISGLKH